MAGAAAAHLHIAPALLLFVLAKKITVLGATANIGTALVHHLLDSGHHVTAVARPSARLDALAAAGATTKAGDAHGAAFLTEVLRGADAAFLIIPPNVAAPPISSLTTSKLAKPPCRPCAHRA